MRENQKHVETLIKRSAEAKSGIEAMQYAQAAANAASADCALRTDLAYGKDGEGSNTTR